MRAQDRFVAGVIRYYFWNFRGARPTSTPTWMRCPTATEPSKRATTAALSSAAQDTTRQLLALANDVPDDDFAPLALLEAGKAQEELGDYASAEKHLRPSGQRPIPPATRPGRRLPTRTRALHARRPVWRAESLGRTAGAANPSRRSARKRSTGVARL